jgi:hypothetical protein
VRGGRGGGEGGQVVQRQNPDKDKEHVIPSQSVQYSLGLEACNRILGISLSYVYIDSLSDWR